MRRILFLCIMSVMLYGCAQHESNEHEEKQHSDKKEALSGSEIFQQNCVSCHGAAGDLGSSGAKNLQMSTLTKEAIEDQVSNGKGMLSAYKNILSEEEIEHVAAYVLTLRK